MLCTFKVLQDKKTRDPSGDEDKIYSKAEIEYEDLVFTDTQH
jgi:hypothetical protein